MKTAIPNFSASIALALMLAFAGSSVAQAECLDNRQIQEAVSSGQIMSLADVLAAAGIDGSAQVLNVAVCDDGGRLVYKIGVLTASGEAENLVLPAQ